MSSRSRWEGIGVVVNQGEKKEKEMPSKLGAADGSETEEWGYLGRRRLSKESIRILNNRWRKRGRSVG